MFFINPEPTLSNFTIRPAQSHEKLVLRNLLELYLHDLSEYWDYDVDAHGLYHYSLDDYFRKAGHPAAATHFPFVFLVEGHYAGFALVNNDVCLPQNERWMAQFFVLRKYRRRGLAGFAARWLFDALPGRWEVGQVPLNKPAQAFWRRVIADYTMGAFEEGWFNDDCWQGALQWFDSSKTSIKSNT